MFLIVEAAFQNDLVGGQDQVRVIADVLQVEIAHTDGNARERWVRARRRADLGRDHGFDEHITAGMGKSADQDIAGLLRAETGVHQEFKS